ncbi:hypothetical protein U1Q18_026757 [Sarracenia purpurea var. burkii]
MCRRKKENPIKVDFSLGGTEAKSNDLEDEEENDEVEEGDSCLGSEEYEDANISRDEIPVVIRTEEVRSEKQSSTPADDKVKTLNPFPNPASSCAEIVAPKGRPEVTKLVCIPDIGNGDQIDKFGLIESFGGSGNKMEW